MQIKSVFQLFPSASLHPEIHTFSHWSSWPPAWQFHPQHASIYIFIRHPQYVSKSSRSVLYLQNNWNALSLWFTHPWSHSSKMNLNIFICDLQPCFLSVAQSRPNTIAVSLLSCTYFLSFLQILFTLVTLLQLFQHACTYFLTSLSNSVFTGLLTLNTSNLSSPSVLCVTSSFHLNLMPTNLHCHALTNLHSSAFQEGSPPL